MSSFPSPEHWILLPACGPGPPVLHRRWTPNDSPIPDYWAPVGLIQTAAPILERHWPSNTQPPQRTDPPPADVRRAQTETLGPRTVTSPAESETLPYGNRAANAETVASASQSVTPPTQSVTPSDEIHPSAIRTINGAAVAPPEQTVTRLCAGCGKPLEGKRPHARSHNPACRQRAYRRRKEAAALARRQRESALQADPQQPGLAHATVA